MEKLNETLNKQKAQQEQQQQQQQNSCSMSLQAEQTKKGTGDYKKSKNGIHPELCFWFRCEENIQKGK